MEALQGQAAKRLQRLPGVFVEPHGPRATQSIDLAGISQHFCQLPWVATEDDYQKFCRCYGLVDVANAIAYHLPTVATHDPFIESAHSKSYGDHARYPEWELEVQQAGFDLSPARHHLVSRWSESDKDTFSLLIASAVAGSASQEGRQDPTGFPTNFGVLYEINKRDPTNRTLVDSWYQATPEFCLQFPERGILSHVLADCVWDVTRPLRETIVTITSVGGKGVKESFRAA